VGFLLALAEKNLAAVAIFIPIFGLNVEAYFRFGVSIEYTFRNGQNITTSNPCFHFYSRSWYRLLCGEVYFLVAPTIVVNGVVSLNY
jgi:hypothetical protein